MAFEELILISFDALTYAALALAAWKSSMKRRVLLETVFFMGMLLSAFMAFSRLFMERREAHVVVLLGALVSVALDCVSLAFISGPSILFKIFFAANAASVLGTALLRLLSTRKRPRKREEAKRAPSRAKRHMGKTEETKLLRAKAPYIVNGDAVIRKGESVQLLKTTGEHYYVVRKFTGAEYVVPKTYFYE